MKEGRGKGKDFDALTGSMGSTTYLCVTVSSSATHLEAEAMSECMFRPRDRQCWKAALPITGRECAHGCCAAAWESCAQDPALPLSGRPGKRGDGQKIQGKTSARGGGPHLDFTCSPLCTEIKSGFCMLYIPAQGRLREPCSGTRSVGVESLLSLLNYGTHVNRH